MTMRRMLEELGFKQSSPTVLHEDNMACIYASSSDRDLTNRSKHIDTQVFRLRQLVEEGEVKLVKIDTHDQVADNLTKPLSRQSLEMSRHVTSGLAFAQQ